MCYVNLLKENPGWKNIMKTMRIDIYECINDR